MQCLEMKCQIEVELKRLPWLLRIVDLYNASFAFSLSILTVTDAGFPRRAPSPKGANLLFGTIFAENCMKKSD